MKHILNEMSEEEKDSIRSQHTGTLKVQTERFKKLVENKLGNAKPLVSEQLDSFTAFEEKELEEDKIEDYDDYDDENEMPDDEEENELDDLPEIHQSIEDEIEGMSDDEAIEFLKETIGFCEDKLNGYDSEEEEEEEEF